MKPKRIIAELLLFAFLVSCAPGTAAPAPTAMPTATTTPTVTPTPIPTILVGIKEIPDPRFSNPELFDLEKANARIPQLTHAFHMTGIEVSAQQINDGLIYKPVSAKNGDSDVLVVTSDIPATSYDEGNIPLFIYMPNADTNEYSWSSAYLKDVSGLHDILMGSVVNGGDEMVPELFYNNFNIATMAWSSVDVPIDIMDRDTKYRLSLITDKHLQEIMWFHLGDIPLQDQTFGSKEEAVEFANTEIDKIVNKYADKITIATIFNEVNPGTIDPVFPLWKRFGDDFLLEVYRHAREILPGRKIVVNNSFNDHKTLGGSTYPYTLELSNLLKANGLIDAVGMQMHQAQSPYGVENPLVVEEAVEVMRSFGLPVYVTELDVNQTYLPGTEQEKLIQQASIFEDVVTACVQSGVCEMINFWGMMDQNSWYEFAVGEPNAEACIFDDDGTPKLAYYTVMRGLLEGY
jgi:GH35 family endo-1,4-beta-xylanase